MNDQIHHEIFQYGLFSQYEINRTHRGYPIIKHGSDTLYDRIDCICLNENSIDKIRKIVTDNETGILCQSIERAREDEILSGIDITESTASLVISEIRSRLENTILFSLHTEKIAGPEDCNFWHAITFGQQAVQLLKNNIPFLSLNHVCISENSAFPKELYKQNPLVKIEIIPRFFLIDTRFNKLQIEIDYQFSLLKQIAKSNQWFGKKWDEKKAYLEKKKFLIIDTNRVYAQIDSPHYEKAISQIAEQQKEISADRPLLFHLVRLHSTKKSEVQQGLNILFIRQVIFKVLPLVALIFLGYVVLRPFIKASKPLI